VSQRRERVLAVQPHAVEPVLGVEDHLAAGAHAPGHAVGDHREILRPRGLEDALDMQRRPLPHERHGRRGRVDQRAEIAVGLRAAARAPGAAECHRAGIREAQAGEPAKDFGVLGIGPRPTRLDVRDSDAIQLARDLELVVDGERDSLALRAVTESSIVQLDHGNLAKDWRT
jgi:hypothetical protein